MSLVIAMPSYLPPQEAIRERRLQIHQEALAFWLESVPEAEYWICSQEYVASDYTQDDRIKYMDYPNGLDQEGTPASVARNKLIEAFYDSDHDYLLILDDDIVLKPFYDGLHLIRQLLGDVPWVHDLGIDLILANRGLRSNHKKQMWNDGKTRTHWKFLAESSLSEQFMILTNVFKRKGKRILYDIEIDARKGTGWENYVFLGQWLHDGLTAYKTPHIVLKELAREADSVVFIGGETKDNMQQNSAATRTILAGMGAKVSYSSNGTARCSKKPLLEMAGMRPVLYVPHPDYTLEIDESMKPKTKKLPMKGLF